MISKTIARRYAQAIFDIAKEQNAVETFAEELRGVYTSISSNEDLQKLVYNRLVPASVKKEIMRQVMSGKTSPMVVNFVDLVFDKSREEYLMSIIEVFDELVDEENKVLQAQVKSAVAMNQEQISGLEANLSKLTGQHVKAMIQVDAALIGGLTVRIGDTVYDGSIAKQLGTLKEHLQQVQLGR